MTNSIHSTHAHLFWPIWICALARSKIDLKSCILLEYEYIFLSAPCPILRVAFLGPMLSVVAPIRGADDADAGDGSGMGGLALSRASEPLRRSPSMIYEAMSRNIYALDYASDSLRSDRAFVLRAVRANGRALRYAPAELRDDAEIVLAAVGSDPLSIRHASDRLRRDPDVVLQAIRADICALSVVSEDIEDLRTDRRFVMAAVAETWLPLDFACPELRDDRQVVLAALRQWGDALGCASEELRDDDEIVLAAVAQDGNSLRHASNRLQKDERIVLEAELSLIGEPNRLREANDAASSIWPQVLKRAGKSLTCLYLHLKQRPEFILQDR